MAKIETGPVAADLARVAEGSQEAMQRVAAGSPTWNATLRTTCVATNSKVAMPGMPAAARGRERELPGTAGGLAGIRAERAAESRGRRPGIRQDRRRRCQRPRFTHEPRSTQRRKPRHQPSVAGRAGRPNHGHGATDGLYLRSSGHSTYGIQGFFLDRNDIRFHGRDETHERAIVLRRTNVFVRSGEDPLKGWRVRACIRPCRPAWPY